MTDNTRLIFTHVWCAFGASLVQDYTVKTGDSVPTMAELTAKNNSRNTAFRLVKGTPCDHTQNAADTRGEGGEPAVCVGAQRRGDGNRLETQLERPI